MINYCACSGACSTTSILRGCTLLSNYVDGPNAYPCCCVPCTMPIECAAASWWDTSVMDVLILNRRTQYDCNQLFIKNCTSSCSIIKGYLQIRSRHQETNYTWNESIWLPEVSSLKCRVCTCIHDACTHNNAQIGSASSMHIAQHHEHYLWDCCRGS
jgi:hypothetical protein